MADVIQHDFARMMPDAWRVFYRHRSPRPIQHAVMPLLLRGESVVLSAPTASGKTEAAFAPLYQRHVSFRRQKLSVVYVAPTKALVNDMYERLVQYFGEASSDLIQRYTGDHHDFSGADGRFALVATPEALDSVQLMRPSLFTGVRAVISDELHLLHGTARGQQLRAVFARIRAQAESPRDSRDVFQVIGTTATVRDTAEVATLWCGAEGKVVAVGEPREMDLSLLPATRTQTASVLTAHFRQRSALKALIFANSRNRAHALAAALNEELRDERWPVFLHIGILSRAERERVESGMKRERRAICVATSTLEVGIDIGDIDVIVMADPPATVSGFLQRAGRGNRRSDRCVVWACPQDQFETNLFLAMKQCAERGELDEVHDYHRPSVDFQQVLSAAWFGVRQDLPLTQANVGLRTGGAVEPAVIDDMVATGALRNVRGALVPSDDWCDAGDERTIHSVIVGSVAVPIVDIHSGEVLGHGAPTDRFGGVLYSGSGPRSVRGGDDAGVYVGSSAQGQPGPLVTLPTARGARRGLSRQVVRRLVELGGDDATRWRRDGGRVLTWGGQRYNDLLRAVLIASGGPKQIRADDFGLSGVEPNREVTPTSAMSLSLDVFSRGRLSGKLAEKFRDGTQFLSALSPELQAEEARRSVPQRGYLGWLGECVAATVS